jgi:DNA-binding PadR family transcriptional regulator
LRGRESVNHLDDVWTAFGSLVCLHSLDLFVIIEEMARRNNLGDFELMVMLALMRLDNDAYGVPISREIEQQCGREIALGSVYAALERLEGKGLVSSEIGKPTAERGGKAKRYFRITKNGLRKVQETRKALMKLWQGLPELEGARP